MLTLPFWRHEGSIPLEHSSKIQISSIFNLNCGYVKFIHNPVQLIRSIDIGNTRVSMTVSLSAGSNFRQIQ